MPSGTDFQPMPAGPCPVPLQWSSRRPGWCRPPRATARPVRNRRDWNISWITWPDSVARDWPAFQMNFSCSVFQRSPARSTIRTQTPRSLSLWQWMVNSRVVPQPHQIGSLGQMAGVDRVRPGGAVVPGNSRVVVQVFGGRKVVGPGNGHHPSGLHLADPGLPGRYSLPGRSKKRPPSSQVSPASRLLSKTPYWPEGLEPSGILKMPATASKSPSAV